MASYALIKDIRSTALFYIRLKFDFAYEAVEDFNLLVFEAVGACYTLMDNDLLNQLVKQRGGQLRDYCVFLYQSNPPFRVCCRRYRLRDLLSLVGGYVFVGAVVMYPTILPPCTKNVAFILPIAEKCGIMNYDDMEGRAL